MSTKQKLTRQESWPIMLFDYLEGRASTSFLWGSFDCCLFAADWVREVTGFDPAAEYRGRYESAIGAARILKAAGGVRGLADKHLPRVRLNMAKRGDVVAFRMGPGKPAWLNTALGILDARNAFFAGPDGLISLPRSDCQRWAWKVGAA